MAPARPKIAAAAVGTLLIYPAPVADAEAC